MFFNPKHIIIKIIAGIVCVCFLWQDTVWAAGGDFVNRNYLRQIQIRQQLEDGVAQAGNGQANSAGWHGKLIQEREILLLADGPHAPIKETGEVIREYEYAIDVPDNITILFGSACTEYERLLQEGRAVIKFEDVPDVASAFIERSTGLLIYHALTEGVLFAMQKIPLKGRIVADFGSGLGVSVIAAARLGAEKSIGIDQDTARLKKSNFYAAQNGVARETDFVHGMIEDLDAEQLGVEGIDVALVNLPKAGLPNISRIANEFRPADIIFTCEDLDIVKRLKAELDALHIQITDTIRVPFTEFGEKLHGRKGIDEPCYIITARPENSAVGAASAAGAEPANSFVEGLKKHPVAASLLLMLIQAPIIPLIIKLIRIYQPLVYQMHYLVWAVLFSFVAGIISNLSQKGLKWTEVINPIRPFKEVWGLANRIQRLELLAIPFIAQFVIAMLFCYSILHITGGAYYIIVSSSHIMLWLSALSLKKHPTFDKENPNSRKLLGNMFIFIGIALLAAQKGLSVQWPSMLLATAAALASTYLNLLFKKVYNQVNDSNDETFAGKDRKARLLKNLPIAITQGMYFVSAFCFGILALSVDFLHKFNLLPSFLEKFFQGDINVLSGLSDFSLLWRWEFPLFAVIYIMVWPVVNLIMSIRDFPVTRYYPVTGIIVSLVAFFEIFLYRSISFDLWYLFAAILTSAGVYCAASTNKNNNNDSDTVSSSATGDSAGRATANSTGIIALPALSPRVKAYIDDAVAKDKCIIYTFDLDHSLAKDSDSEIGLETAQLLLRLLRIRTDKGVYVLVSTMRSRHQIAARLLAPLLKASGVYISPRQARNTEYLLEQAKICFPNLIPLPHGGIEYVPREKEAEAIDKLHGEIDVRSMSEALRGIRRTSRPEDIIDRLLVSFSHRAAAMIQHCSLEFGPLIDGPIPFMRGVMDQEENLVDPASRLLLVRGGEILKMAHMPYSKKINYVIIDEGIKVIIALYELRERLKSRPELFEKVRQRLIGLLRDAGLNAYRGGRASVNIVINTKSDGVFSCVDAILNQKGLEYGHVAMAVVDDECLRDEMGGELFRQSYTLYQGLGIGPLGRGAVDIPAYRYPISGNTALVREEGPPVVNAVIQSSLEAFVSAAGATGQKGGRLVWHRSKLRDLVEDYVRRVLFQSKPLVVFFDLDNSIAFDSRQQIQETIAEAFRRLLSISNQAGIRVVILTNRNMPAIRNRFIEPLGINTADYPMFKSLPDCGIDILAGNASVEADLERVVTACEDALNDLDIGIDKIIKVQREDDFSGIQKDKNYLIIREGVGVTLGLYRTIFNEIRESDINGLILRRAVCQRLSDYGVRNGFVGGEASIDIFLFDKFAAAREVLRQVSVETGVPRQEIGVLAIDDEFMRGYGGRRLLEFVAEHKGLGIAPARKGIGPGSEKQAPPQTLIFLERGPDASAIVAGAIIRAASAAGDLDSDAGAAGQAITAGANGVYTITELIRDLKFIINNNAVVRPWKLTEVLWETPFVQSAIASGLFQSRNGKLQTKKLILMQLSVLEEAVRRAQDPGEALTLEQAQFLQTLIEHASEIFEYADDLKVAQAAKAGRSLDYADIPKMDPDIISLAGRSMLTYTGATGPLDEVDAGDDGSVNGSAVGIGIDGKEYKDVEIDKTNIDVSDENLKVVAAWITERAAARDWKALSRDEAVGEVGELLEQLIQHRNCSDPLFEENMKDHMREMPDMILFVIKNLYGEGVSISPELLIVGLLHDASNLFDGYYIMAKDAPAQDTDWYKCYTKPVQHPALVVKFIMPQLEAFGIDARTRKKIGVLIRHHERGAVELPGERTAYAECFTDEEWAALMQDAQILMAADSISYFTPHHISTGCRELRKAGRDPYHQVYLKYARDPQLQPLIDELMERNKDELLATPDGEFAYEFFLRVQRDVAAAGAAGGVSANSAGDLEAAAQKASGVLLNEILKPQGIDAQCATEIVKVPSGKSIIKLNLAGLTPKQKARMLLPEEVSEDLVQTVAGEIEQGKPYDEIDRHVEGFGQHLLTGETLNGVTSELLRTLTERQGSRFEFSVSLDMDGFRDYRELVLAREIEEAAGLSREDNPWHVYTYSVFETKMATRMLHRRLPRKHFSFSGPERTGYGWEGRFTIIALNRPKPYTAIVKTQTPRPYTFEETEEYFGQHPIVEVSVRNTVNKRGSDLAVGVFVLVRMPNGSVMQGFMPNSLAGRYRHRLAELVKRVSCFARCIAVERGPRDKIHLKFELFDPEGASTAFAAGRSGREAAIERAVAYADGLQRGQFDTATEALEVNDMEARRRARVLLINHDPFRALECVQVFELLYEEIGLDADNITLLIKPKRGEIEGLTSREDFDLIITIKAKDGAIIIAGIEETDIVLPASSLRDGSLKDKIEQWL